MVFKWFWKDKYQQILTFSQFGQITLHSQQCSLCDDLTKEIAKIETRILSVSPLYAEEDNSIKLTCLRA